MIVATLGTFDILHPGHLELLRACWSAAFPHPHVVVGLNRDSFVERFKGKPPVLTFEERRECLLACRYVDGVVTNTHNEDASYVLQLIAPNILMVGSDWQDRDYMAQLGGRAERYLKERSIPVIYVPRAEPHKISSTILKKRIVDEYFTKYGLPDELA